MSMSEQIGIPEQPNTISPETISVPEQRESLPIKKEEKKTDDASGAQVDPAAIVTNVQQDLPQPKVQKSETLERIEDIMEEDLADVYKNLPPEVKKEFREKGEEVAVEIEGMMHHVKIKSKQVFKALFGWMKIIPGVNKYFLKQEAKIKTDEIMHVKEELDKASHGQIDT